MPLNIIIVGAGIAGLGTAIALTNKGHNVTVLEATSQLQPIGGTIVMQANAIRVLDSLGVYESLFHICATKPFGSSVRRYRDGAFLTNKSAENHKSNYGYPLWAFHRADLQQVLYAAAKKRRVTLRLGCPVIGVEEDDHTLVVVTKSGERIDADVVVGADGVKSAVRNIIHPNASCIRDSGMDVTRILIPEAAVQSAPETSIFMTEISNWVGPFTTLAIMPVHRGDEWFLGLDCCHVRCQPLAEDTSRNQNLENLISCFKDYDPVIQKLLAQATEAHVWRLTETMPASWVSASGRVVLIGDAAHATLPWTGQGGGMALEDAVTLAECLERVDKSNIPEALKAFQEIRQPRCKLMQEWAARKGKQAILRDGPEQEQRDQNLKLFNAWVMARPCDGSCTAGLPEIHSPVFETLDWMAGHNAVEFARQKLEGIFGERHYRRSPISELCSKVISLKAVN